MGRVKGDQNENKASELHSDSKTCGPVTVISMQMFCNI